MSADNYKVWNWDFKSGTRLKTMEQKIKYCVEAGILAPSIHNSQPWKFKIEENALKVIPDLRYHLKRIDPDGHDLLISLGCCIENIMIAAAYVGIDTSVSVTGERLTDLKIVLGFMPTKEKLTLSALCEYIARRASNKKPYLSKPIPDKIISLLNDLKMNSQQNIVSNHSDKSDDVIRIHSFATSNKVDKSFIKELTLWMRHNKTRAYDGMPGFVLGIKTVPSVLARIFIKYIPKFHKIIVKQDTKLIRSSSGFGIIAGKRGLYSYIDIGRLYELVALTALSNGLSVSPMHAIASHEESMIQLKQTLNLSQAAISFFYRIGYPINSEILHTPRRPIGMVLD